MTYSPETQALLAAVMSGDVCPECSAPNDQRHFDNCSRHPENISMAAAVRAIDARNDERESLKQANAFRWRELDAMNAENRELRAELATVSAERDAALLRADQAEGELHDLQERNADIAAGVENWHGRSAVQS